MHRETAIRRHHPDFYLGRRLFAEKTAKIVAPFDEPAFMELAIALGILDRDGSVAYPAVFGL